MSREQTIDRRGRTGTAGLWERRVPVFPPRPWIPDDDALSRVSPEPLPKMRVLSTVASSNQMYSGVGRVLRELAARTTRWIDWEFAIDDWPGGERNRRILQEFAEGHGMRLHVGRHELREDSCDPINLDLPALLQSTKWDAIELLGWANNGTNKIVLENARDAVVVYTPHNQPLWTVPMAPERQLNVLDTHTQLLRRAELVFADSPAERWELQRHTEGRNNCVYLPLGCDFEQFQPGSSHRPPQLLFVGDFREIRKRFDRVVDVFERIHGEAPQYRLVVVGNKSLDAGDIIPVHLRPSVVLKGYISEEELRRLYAESRALFLLTDFEAFGLPILESLASGTPVFTSKLPELEGLFGDCRGAHFCEQTHPESTARTVLDTLAQHEQAIGEAIDDIPRLRTVFDWDQIAVKKWQFMASAWSRKHYWSFRSS